MTNNIAVVTLATVLAESLSNEIGVNFLDALEAVQAEFEKHDAEPITIDNTKEIWNEAKIRITTRNPGDMRD